MQQREIIAKTIMEVCQHRNWELKEVNVRTNHVHVVVAGDGTPNKIMNDFKAYSTKKLRESNSKYQHRKIWTEGRSTRYLWNEDSVTSACEYVRNQ